jgi:hypothetical protein
MAAANSINGRELAAGSVGKTGQKYCRKGVKLDFITSSLIAVHTG